MPNFFRSNILICPFFISLAHLLSRYSALSYLAVEGKRRCIVKLCSTTFIICLSKRIKNRQSRTLVWKSDKIQLLSNNQNINYGAIYENVVAQELKAHGFKLYYFNSRKTGELDFVIEYNGEILPIEVKSGKDYNRHSALNNVLNISNYSVKEAFVLSNYNVSVVDKITYYPIYMLMFIRNDDIKMPKIELDDLSTL